MFYFRYRAADWVKRNGLPTHHLRIISPHVNPWDGQCWYCIFDTTLSRRYADYSWVLADILERGSEIVMHAENDIHAYDILQLCERLRFLSYSIPQRQDCESLQRFIQAGREADRWSPQVQVGLVLGLAALGVGLSISAASNK